MSHFGVYLCPEYIFTWCLTLMPLSHTMCPKTLFRKTKELSFLKKIATKIKSKNFRLKIKLQKMRFSTESRMFEVKTICHYLFQKILNRVKGIDYI